MVNGTLKEVVQLVQHWCGVQLVGEGRQVVINNILSDDALLYVFDFYVAQASRVETWRTLAHVCRRWRSLVFASPRRLNLRIVCTSDIPLREKLDVWPALPIVVSNYCGFPRFFRDVKAALEHHDRVCQIKLHLASWEVADAFAALDAPFPVLIDLDLASNGSNPSFPNSVKSFRGFTNLQSLSVSGIPVSGLPELLSSSTSLRVIDLENIHHPSFFSPREMATALSALTRLEVLHIGLETEPDRLCLDRESQCLPLPPRAILPSLTAFKFEGFSKYLEDLMARIDAPLLDHLVIAYTRCYVQIDHDIELDTPQLLRFISCIPKFQAPDQAHMGMDTCQSKFWIKFSRQKQIFGAVRLEVRCPWAERYMSHLAQLCRSPFFPLPTLEHLYICGGRRSPICPPANTLWLELFQPFTAVKNLYLSKEYAQHIVAALVGERAMEVLPTLEKVFIDHPCGFRQLEPCREVIGKFAAARQLSGHPIVVFPWDERQHRAGPVRVEKYFAA